MLPEPEEEMPVTAARTFIGLSLLPRGEATADHIPRGERSESSRDMQPKRLYNRTLLSAAQVHTCSFQFLLARTFMQKFWLSTWLIAFTQRKRASS